MTKNAILALTVFAAAYAFAPTAAEAMAPKQQMTKSQRVKADRAWDVGDDKYLARNQKKQTNVVGGPIEWLDPTLK